MGSLRRLPLTLALLTLGVPARAAASKVDLTAWIGPAFPFYEQGFEYDPGPLSLPVPGATIAQRGIFTLQARGGLALGGVLGWNVSPHVGVELRLDTADVRVRTQGARYAVRLRLPPPVPLALDREVDLGTGDVDVERVRPLSLNLRVRTGGRLRLAASAGGSWLPRFRLEANQAVGLGLPGFDGSLPGTALANVSLAAEALPEERGEGRLGFNGGAGLQARVGSRVWVAVEGRYFWFQRQTLHWGGARSDVPLPPLEAELVRQIEEGLAPAKFNPTFFQATAGLVLGF